MAVVATASVNRPATKSWTIKCAEADISLAFAHGFGVAPDKVSVVPQNSAIALAGAPGVTADAVNITFTKQNAVGSAGAVPGTTVAYKVYAEIPHSII